jgi:ribosome-interacting GTPase 1
MMRIAGASVQVLDMPGLVPGASKGKGRGREVLSVVRGVDLVTFLIDPEHPNFRALREELEGAGVRINTRAPKIAIYRGDRGGLNVASTVKLHRLSDGLAVGIAREFGLHNGSLVFREDASEDQLIDALAGNRVYLPAILVVNKAEGLTNAEKAAFRKTLAPFEPIFISAKNRTGLDELMKGIAAALAFIRIYMKPPGRDPDLVEPVILRKGSTVGDLIARLPGDFEKNFKAAQVWGPSARFPGQTVGRDHPLEDTDIVTVVIVRGGRSAD